MCILEVSMLMKVMSKGNEPDLVHTGGYHFGYFLRKVEPHSVILKVCRTFHGQHFLKVTHMITADPVFRGQSQSCTSSRTGEARPI